MVVTLFRRHLSLGIFLAALLLPATLLQAAQIQSLDSIRQAARQALLEQYQKANITIEIGSLDPRLRLPLCGTPLDTFFPQGNTGNRPIIGVRCQSPKRWTIYVSAKIHQTVQALVANQYLKRGTILHAEDLKAKSFDISELKFGYFTDSKEVLGKTLKRHLSRGAVLTPSNLAVTKIIHRGERVTIVATTGGISVQAAGQALEDGGMGDIIRVKNLNSKKVIEGRVEAPGRVKVDL